MKAICKQNFETFSGIPDSVSIGCSTTYFKQGEEYGVDINSFLSLNHTGALQHIISIDVYHGSLDAYDRATGIHIYNIDVFNQYFQLDKEAQYEL